MEKPNRHPIIFFDGVCNLCNGAVNWIIQRDKKHHFRFAHLQGEFARQRLKSSTAKGDDLSSIVLVEDGKLYTESTAALRIAKTLSGLWPLLYAFIVIPPFIRNGVYQFIAKNRYRWFGKQDNCMIPTPEKKALFIE